MSGYVIRPHDQMIETEVVRLSLLSPRQLEVVYQVLEGKSSRNIADALQISKRTVDYHIANIYRKLKARNRVELFRSALGAGLIVVKLE